MNASRRFREGQRFDPAGFRESQRFHQSRVGGWVFLAGAAAVGLTVLALAGSGDFLHPAGLLGIAIGAGTIALFGVAELRVEVRPDALHVRFFPLTREHRFDWTQIASAEARSYRPIREYGGWGVRFGRHGKAYNVYGDRGVQLAFHDGRRLLIGSQRADELAAAIASARGARP
jgi:hypothetical protein